MWVERSNRKGNALEAKCQFIARAKKDLIEKGFEIARTVDNVHNFHPVPFGKIKDEPVFETSYLPTA